MYTNTDHFTPLALHVWGKNELQCKDDVPAKRKECEVKLSCLTRNINIKLSKLFTLYMKNEKNRLLMDYVHY